MTTELAPIYESSNPLYHNGTPLFSVDCEEPSGTVRRNVYLAAFTPEFLRDLWEKQKKYRTLMGREMLHFPQFVDFFVDVKRDENGNVKYEPRGLCLVIDNLVGIFWIADVNWPSYCEAHYTFFDGRHKGRHGLVKEGCKYVFENLGINLIYVMVAAYATLPRKFVEELGFKREGRLRSRAYYREQWWDVISYSLLKEELTSG